MTNLAVDDIKLIKASLSALVTILEHGQELRKSYHGSNPYVTRILESNASNILEELQYHSDNEVYTIVSTVLQRYFPVEAT
jgi:hypothetical protein